MTSPVATRSQGQPRSIALFGGTFDPIHSGHIAVAQAARRRFHLDAIYFIPSSRPPHKSKLTLTPFAHRYAMAALCARITRASCLHWRKRRIRAALMFSILWIQ